MTTNQHKQVYRLTSEAILKYMLGKSEYIDTLIMCRSTECTITTTDFALYEALGSLQPYDEFNKSRLVKFLEAVHIDHAEKKILTHDRVDELRKAALAEKGETNGR